MFSIVAVNHFVFLMHIQSRLFVLQVFEVIEGILDVRKGAVLSVCRAVQNGLIDHCTGLSLLEAQLITSELILPEFHMCLDLEDAFKHNLVDEPMYKQLRDLNKANKCIQTPRYASEPLPMVAAVKDGAISEHLAVKIIEIQLATGGLRVTYTGDSLSLERAFEFGLIPQSLYIKILQRQNTWKDLIDPNTAEKVSLIQLVQRSVVHEETGLCLLPVKSGKDGSIACRSGGDVSILRAMHEGLIDQETMLRLLSAQLFAGGIIHPRTNQKLTVEEALSEGLIDQDTASGILSHQAKNGGIVNPKNGARLTVDEAVQCDLMSSRSALLVLERQKSFMGLLWPHSGEILTVSMAIEHEIITERLAHELLCNRHKIVAFYIPENSEVVDIDSAAKNDFINAYTLDFLKTIEIPDMFPDVDDLYERFSSWLVMRELQIEGSEKYRVGLETNAKSIKAPSSLEAKQLFVSFLMMNSYMDPKSGQRLLILDRQLNKMAKVLLEMSDADTHANVKDSSRDEDFPDDEHITYTSELAVLRIDEPLPKIAEGSISESTEGDCGIKTATFETNLASGSGEIFNMTLESASYKASAPEIKTDESATEHTFTDACKKNRTNKALHSSVQPSNETHISQSSNPTIDQPNLLSKVEKNVPLDHREHSIGVIQKDSTQCSVLSSKEAERFESLTKYTQVEGVDEKAIERDHEIHRMRDQLKEGGVLDVTSYSGKRYNLDDAFAKGFIDEETLLEVLALQLGRQSMMRNETVTMSILKQAVSQGYISSDMALQIIQQQSLLSGSYDSSGKYISAKEAWEMGLISDVDIGSLGLDSELTQKASVDPDGKCVCSVYKPKTVQEQEEAKDAVDMSQKSNENAVNRSEGITDSSISNEGLTAKKKGRIGPSTEHLLAASAQMTNGLDSTFLLKTLSDDVITAHKNDSVEINAVDFSEKCPNTEHEGHVTKELNKSNQFTSSSDSPFSLNPVRYEGITAEDLAVRRPDEINNILTTPTELTGYLDSPSTLKIVSDDEKSEIPSSDYGLLRTDESNEKIEEKCLNTENEMEPTEKATQPTLPTDHLETLKTVNKKDITYWNITDKSPNTEIRIETLEEDRNLSANSEISSTLYTSCNFKAGNDEELGEKSPDFQPAVSSKQITSGLDSPFLLKTDNDVTVTASQKESLEIPAVDFSQKCPSIDNTVNRTDHDTHLSADSKQKISSLDSLFTLSRVSDEISLEKFGEKSPSTENAAKRPHEVTSLLTNSTQSASILDSSSSLKTTTDKITAKDSDETSTQMTAKELSKTGQSSEHELSTTQDMYSLDSLFTLKTAEIPVKKCQTTENVVKRTEEESPELMSSSLECSFTFQAVSEGITNDTLGENKSDTELFLSVIETDPSISLMIDNYEVHAEDLNRKSPSIENAANRTEKATNVSINTTQGIYNLDSALTQNEYALNRTVEATARLTTSTQMISNLDSSFTLKTNCEQTVGDVFGQKCPSTENSVRMSDEASLSTNLTRIKNSLDFSSTVMTTGDEIPAGDLSEKCPSTANSDGALDSASLSTDVTQMTSSLDSSLTAMINSDEIPAKNLNKKRQIAENVATTTEKATHPLMTPRVTSSLDPFTLTPCGDEITDELVTEKCPSVEKVNMTEKDVPPRSSIQPANRSDSSLISKTADDETETGMNVIKETRFRLRNTENVLNRPEEIPALLSNTTQTISNLHSGSDSESVTNDELGEKKYPNLLKRTEVTTDVLKTVSDIPSAGGLEAEQIIHTSGLDQLDDSDCLDTTCSGDRNDTDLGKGPDKGNSRSDAVSFNIPFNAADRDEAFNEAAVNQRGSSVQSDAGISCSSRRDIYTGDKKSDNIHKWYSVFNEPQQTASTSLDERGLESLDVTEDLKTLRHSKPPLSSSTLRDLSEITATGNPSENTQVWEDSVVSPSTDCFVQTNMKEGDLDLCALSKTSAIMERHEHESKSGTVSDCVRVKAVETQSSHIGVSVNHKTINDFDLVSVDTSESQDMSKLYCGENPETSLTLTFLSDVTVSADSNDKEHLAEQKGVPGRAVDSNQPGFVISEKNSNDGRTSQSEPDITPVHIVEKSSESAASKSTLPPNSSDNGLLNGHTSQDTAETENEFPPVYSNELEQTAMKGTVNEIQSNTSQALDNSDRISPAAATQHDSHVAQVLDEVGDPDLLKDLCQHEGLFSGCVNQEKCLSDVTGHDEEPSSPVLMQSQLPEMMQEMSAKKEPETLKESSSLLGTTAQGNEDSCVEGVEAELKAASHDACDHDVLESGLSNQQSSKANGSSIEEVKVRPRVSIYPEIRFKFVLYYTYLSDNYFVICCRYVAPRITWNVLVNYRTTVMHLKT